VGHSGVRVEYRWHQGFASHEVPRSRDSCGRRGMKGRGAEILVDAWQSIRWDRVSRGLADLEGENSTVQPARLRGREAANSREALTFSLAHGYMWKKLYPYRQI
jgi:hypothetical protein